MLTEAFSLRSFLSRTLRINDEFDMPQGVKWPEGPLGFHRTDPDDAEKKDFTSRIVFVWRIKLWEVNDGLSRYRNETDWKCSTDTARRLSVRYLIWVNRLFNETNLTTIRGQKIRAIFTYFKNSLHSPSGLRCTILFGKPRMCWTDPSTVAFSDGRLSIQPLTRDHRAQQRPRIVRVRIGDPIDTLSYRLIASFRRSWFRSPGCAFLSRRSYEYHVSGRPLILRGPGN